MEFTHFSKYAFNYIGTRMRSNSKYESFIRCSMNPHPNHFIHEYVDMFIDQDTGLAKSELGGKPAYYILKDNSVVTSFDKDKLEEENPGCDALKYSFVPSKLEDNGFMLAKNKNYAQKLQATGKANAEMLLSGNWRYSPEANGMWERNTVQIVEKIPLNSVYFRIWDKASSKPAKEGGDSKQLNPDYTANIGMAKDKDGFVYIFGDYVTDENDIQISRIREKPGPRDAHIEKQCIKDGIDTKIVMPQDPGAAGVVEFQESAKKLQSLGFTVLKDPSVSNRSKRLRFEPFASACHIGNVFWVKNSFHPTVWDYMLLELENFDGDKNNGFHDDLADCFSSGWCITQKTKVHKAISLPQRITKTQLSGMRDQMYHRKVRPFRQRNSPK